MTSVWSPWMAVLPLALSAACSSTSLKNPSRGGQAGDRVNAVTIQSVSPSTGLVEKGISEMAPTDVIVAVNGVSLTKQSFDAGVASTIQKVSSRPGMNPQALPQIQRQIARKLIPDFVRRQLLVQEARRLNIKPPAEAQDLARKEEEKAAANLGMTVEELRKSALPQAVFIRDAIDAAPLIATLLKEKVAPRISVSDEFVTNTIMTIDAENKEVDKRNAEKKAMLAGLRTQILSGADFNALADKYSEAPRYMATDPGYWGTFERTEIADRDMSDAIFSLKTNEVSDVLSDEEGFRIVKMVKRNPAVKDSKQEVVSRESCELAHILLLREPSLNNMPPEMMKKELTRQATTRLTTEFVEQLASQAMIEYPHGTNLWKQASGTNAPARRPRSTGRLTPPIEGFLPPPQRPASDSGVTPAQP